MKKRNWSIMLIILVLCLIFYVPYKFKLKDSFRKKLSDCETIKNSGLYFLSENILSTHHVCVIISSNNTILDCDNHLIIGKNLPGSVGIYIKASNVTVKNCIIQKFERGIWTSIGTCCNKIINNTISFLNTTKEYHAGIGAFGEYLLIENNTIFNTSLFCEKTKKGRGIWGFPNHSIIRGNLIYNICGHGISLSSHLPPFSIVNNTIEKDVIRNIPFLDHTAGIRNAEGVAFSVIKDNFIENVPFAISLDKGDIPGDSPRWVDVSNNVIKDAYIGIYMDSGGVPLEMNAKIYNNTFINVTKSFFIEPTLSGITFLSN